MTAFEKRYGIVVRDRAGSHGRGSLSEAKLGSVSNAVVHSIHPPVVVARHS
ncbi:universal stress protein family protein [Mycobacterium lentiflavum]|uniref:Universal stress protein family protein n=1 Tax=Mycobacterium lentiflavum TaxID=141349 RepID=A0A0E4GYW5_MYCLN|nr:universal stress protein family protein [Mycobacterium lentiflavum]